MTKAELITRVAKDVSLTRRQAEQVLEALLAQIQAALSRGEPVTLTGFGSFSRMAPRGTLPPARGRRGLGRTVPPARWGYRRGDLVAGSPEPFSRDERAHR